MTAGLTYLLSSNPFSSIYQSKLSDSDKLVLTNQQKIIQLSKHMPEALVINIRCVLDILRDSPLPYTMDILQYIYKIVSIKKSITFKIDNELTAVYEYYLDYVNSLLLGDGDTLPGIKDEYRHSIAAVQHQCILMESAVFSAMVDINLKGLYLSDLFFPYSLVSMAPDQESGIFLKTTDFSLDE